MKDFSYCFKTIKDFAIPSFYRPLESSVPGRCHVPSAFRLRLYPPDPSPNSAATATTCSKARPSTTPKPEARTPLGLTGRRRQADLSPARPLRWRHRPPLDLAAPPPSLPTVVSGCRVSGDYGGVSAGGHTSGRRGILLLLGARQVSGHCGREEARLGGQDPGAGFLFLPGRRAGSTREAAGPDWAGPGRRRERTGWVWRRGPGSRRLPAFLRRKSTYCPFSAFSVPVGVCHAPSSQSLYMGGWEGLQRRVLVPVARYELPSPGARSSFPPLRGVKAKSASGCDPPLRPSFELGNESLVVRTPSGFCWLHLKKKERKDQKILEKKQSYLFLFPSGVEVHVFTVPSKIGGKCRAGPLSVIS